MQTPIETTALPHDEGDANQVSEIDTVEKVLREVGRLRVR